MLRAFKKLSQSPLPTNQVPSPFRAHWTDYKSVFAATQIAPPRTAAPFFTFGVLIDSVVALIDCMYEQDSFHALTIEICIAGTHIGNRKIDLPEKIQVNEDSSGSGGSSATA